MCHITTVFKIERPPGLPPEPPPFYTPVPISHSSKEIQQYEYFSSHPHFCSPITNYFTFEDVFSLLFCHAAPQQSPDHQITTTHNSILSKICCAPTYNKHKSTSLTIIQEPLLAITMTSDFLDKLTTLGIGLNKQRGFSYFAQPFTYFHRQCE